MFCSVILCGLVKSILRAKRSFVVMFSHFCKIKKKRASASSRGRKWVVPYLLYQSWKNQPDGTRCKKSYSRFHISGNLATHNILPIYHWSNIFSAFFIGFKTNFGFFWHQLNHDWSTSRSNIQTLSQNLYSPSFVL